MVTKPCDLFCLLNSFGNDFNSKILSRSEDSTQDRLLYPLFMNITD